MNEHAKVVQRKWTTMSLARWSSSVCATITLVLMAISICFAPLTPAVHAEAAQIRVALLVNPGTEASEFRKELRNNVDDSISCQVIHNSDLRDGALKDFQALIIPGGSATTESTTMGAEARDEIKRFINDGGIYLGVCAGAYLASSLKKVYLGLLPIKTNDSEHWWRTDGAPKLLVELTPAGQEVFGIQSKYVSIAYENGPVFSPPFEKPDDSYTPLGYFREEVVGDGGSPGVMIGAPAAILSRYGKGVILVISPHPEETPGLKQVELHAIRWLYEHRNSNMTDFVSNEKSSGKIALIKHVAPELKTASIVSQHIPAATGRKQEPEHETARVTARETEPEQAQKQEQDQKQDQKRNESPSRDTLGERALSLAESVFDRATTVRYSHHEVPASRQITTDGGDNVQVVTDCSGFISYLVHSVAPRHYAAVRSREPGHSYPQAKVWANFFTELDSDQAHDGWIRVEKWKDLRPGDIVAWKEGKSSSSNTGHVMMVANAPGNVQESKGYRYVEVPVIDASSVYHFPPEHLPPKAYQKHRNGLGVGCIRIVLSNEDTPIGYWEGSYWGEGEKEIDHPTMSKVIGFGRMVSLEENTLTK